MTESVTQKRSIAGFLIDILLVTISFLISVQLKPGGSSVYYTNYLFSFFVFLLIWMLISVLSRKYQLFARNEKGDLLKSVILSNAISFFVIAGIIYLFQRFHYSRFIVLGTVIIATLAEMATGVLYSLFTVRAEGNGKGRNSNGNADRQEITFTRSTAARQNMEEIRYDYNARIDYLKNEIGEEAFRYIFHYGAIDSPNTLVIGTNTRFTIDAQIQPLFECIININRVNDFRYINKFFEAVSAKLPVGGIFIDHFETKSMRKHRILEKFLFPFNHLYYMVDFIVKRVFPKFALTKKLYFILTRGENRVLTKAETFGRLYSCGFEVLDEKQIGNNLFFVALKVKSPSYPKNPSYGPLVALERIGKGGQPIRVFKMRTMHPFAEYLQDYMYKRDGLQEGGKFKDDFRVTSVGRFMRTFWIDELPMLINLLKGDLKIMGVRPLSRQYFKLYTLELQRMRIRHKPGLIPPFYVDYPKTLEEIMTSELNYLRAYEKHPFKTDWKYFWKATYNILFKKYRSR